MDLDCGGGSLVIFWCWVDFGAGLVGRWNFGTLSIFRCLVIFLVLGGFWCWVGRSVDARGVLGLGRDLVDFSVFDDFLGIGWIFEHDQFSGGRCDLRNNCMNLCAVCGLCACPEYNCSIVPPPPPRLPRFRRNLDL